MKVNLKLLIYLVRGSVALVVILASIIFKQAFDSKANFDQLTYLNEQDIFLHQSLESTYDLREFLSREDAGDLEQRDSLTRLISTISEDLKNLTYGDSTYTQETSNDFRLISSLLKKPASSYLLASSKYEQALSMLTKSISNIRVLQASINRAIQKDQQRILKQVAKSSRFSLVAGLSIILLIVIGVYFPSLQLRLNWQRSLANIRDQRLVLISDYRKMHKEYLQMKNELDAVSTQNNLLIQGLAEKDREIQSRLNSITEHYTLYSSITLGPSRLIQQRLNHMLKAKNMVDLDHSELHNLQSELWMLDKGVQLVKKLAQTIKLAQSNVQSNTSLVVGEALSQVQNSESIDLELEGFETLSSHTDALVFILSELFKNSIIHRNGYQSKVRIEFRKELQDISIVYEDDGPGVDLENLERLDTAFYSTKNRIGNGLTAVSILVRYYGGEINYDRSVSGGLAVKFTWPIV